VVTTARKGAGQGDTWVLGGPPALAEFDRRSLPRSAGGGLLTLSAGWWPTEPLLDSGYAERAEPENVARLWTSASTRARRLGLDGDVFGGRGRSKASLPIPRRRDNFEKATGPGGGHDGSRYLPGVNGHVRTRGTAPNSSTRISGQC